MRVIILTSDAKECIMPRSISASIGQRPDSGGNSLGNLMSSIPRISLNHRSARQETALRNLSQPHHLKLDGVVTSDFPKYLIT